MSFEIKGTQRQAVVVKDGEDTNAQYEKNLSITNP